MYRPPALILLALITSMTQPVAAQQEAHVHGFAEINLAIEGGELQIEFVSPAESIVGFEYAPSTDAERHTLEDAIALLRTPDKLGDMPASARCKGHEAEAERHAEGDHDEHAHDEHGEEVHSAFHAHYHFDCANPGSIKKIGVTLFKTWPRIEKVRVQALTPSGQTGGNIEARDPVIRLQ